jgi:hypothetical protein
MGNQMVNGRFLLMVLPEQNNKKHPGMPFIAHAGSHKGLTVRYM